MYVFARHVACGTAANGSEDIGTFFPAKLAALSPMTITSAPTGVDLDVRPLIAPKMAVFMLAHDMRRVPLVVSVGSVFASAIVVVSVMFEILTPIYHTSISVKLSVTIASPASVMRIDADTKAPARYLRPLMTNVSEL